MEKSNEYVNLLGELKKIKMGEKSFSTIEEMNLSIRKFLKFYEDNGIKLTLDNFNNFFGENISNYKVMNNHIYQYMEVFFKNINNLDSYEFIELLFTMNDLEVDNGLIMDEISAMINNFNRRHKDIFDNILNNLFLKYQDLGISKDMFNYDSLNNLIQLLNGKIKLEECKKKIESKDESENDSIELETFFNMIGERLNNEDLLETVKTIVRLRIFKEMFLQYQEYKKLNINKTSDEINFTNNEILNNSSYLKKLLIKFEYSGDKKIDIIKKQKIKKEVIGVVKLIFILKDRLKNIKKNYFLNFYKKYSVNLTEEKFNIDLSDGNKFFGLFDYDNIPDTLNFLTINDICCDSYDFDKLSMLALNIYANLIEEKKTKKLS